MAITPELEREMAQQKAGELINVPEEQRIEFAEDQGGENVIDINAVLQMRAEHGEEILTEDEFAAIAEYESKRAEGGEHYTNLAELLEDNELMGISNKVLEWVEWDEQSREEWYDLEQKGIRELGVSPNKEGGASFAGASTATHPLLAEACVQFNSRALDQLWPAGGPVKTAIMGEVTEERTAQGKRVEQFMNFQYTSLLEDAFEQTDQMLIRLPLSGSCFAKLSYDPVDGIFRDSVSPEHFIVPYRSTSLKTAPRYTERILKGQNDVKKLQVEGFYRNIDLHKPFEDGGDTDHEKVTDEIGATEGREEISQDGDDQRHTLYECYCYLDLAGFEDVGEDGKPTGISLPYVVTVDRDSQKVLSIYRNWRETDTRKKRLVYHVHYRYIPGFGFYGYGLYHWIGGLAKAATGALRALLDAAQFANMPGGFRSKDSALKNGNLEIAPGEWKEIDADADDLSKAFFTLPYKEPSSTLFNLMGAIDDLGRRFAGTTEAMVGEGSQNTPVGTMLARIEQGSKIYTAIQKRLHETAKQEFKLLAHLNSIWLPDQYPYAVQGEERVALRQDFDDRIDIMPVSDPNFVSNTQRYFIAQAALELANTAPHLYDMRELHHRALTSLKMEDIDKILPDNKDMAQRCDPVTENAVVMTGGPVKAYPEQDHQSHIMVHQSALMGMQPKDPGAAVLDAHIREHMAHAYLAQMAQATGIPFMMPDEDKEPLPPEVEMQVAQASAQAAAQMQQEQQPDPELVAEQREQERKDAIAQSDIARKDAATQSDIARRDELAAAEVRRKAAVSLADQARQDEGL